MKYGYQEVLDIFEAQHLGIKEAKERSKIRVKREIAEHLVKSLSSEKDFIKELEGPNGEIIIRAEICVFTEKQIKDFIEEIKLRVIRGSNEKEDSAG